MPMESSRSDTANIRRCLAHSLFMNAAELQPDGTYSTVNSHQLVAIHPSSVLFHCKPSCVQRAAAHQQVLHAGPVRGGCRVAVRRSAGLFPQETQSSQELSWAAGALQGFKAHSVGLLSVLPWV